MCTAIPSALPGVLEIIHHRWEPGAWARPTLCGPLRAAGVLLPVLTDTCQAAGKGLACQLCACALVSSVLSTPQLRALTALCPVWSPVTCKWAPIDDAMPIVHCFSQARGSLHCHVVLWLHPDDAAPTAEDITAAIPGRWDPVTQRMERPDDTTVARLHDLVHSLCAPFTAVYTIHCSVTLPLSD